ncbi:hypothetical protein L9F63_013716, partial [Diploptera punctata]
IKYDLWTLGKIWQPSTVSFSSFASVSGVLFKNICCLLSFRRLVIPTYIYIIFVKSVVTFAISNVSFGLTRNNKKLPTLLLEAEYKYSITKVSNYNVIPLIRLTMWIIQRLEGKVMKRKNKKWSREWLLKRNVRFAVYMPYFIGYDLSCLIKRSVNLNNCLSNVTHIGINSPISMYYYFFLLSYFTTLCSLDMSRHSAIYLRDCKIVILTSFAFSCNMLR